MFQELSTEKLRFVFLTAVIDYLKTNNYRIAAHSLSKTPNPLASRQDIAPLAEKVKDNPDIDIIGLAPSNSIFIARSVYFAPDALIAHQYNDQYFVNSIRSALKLLQSTPKGVEFIFITTGIILPDLIRRTDWGTIFGSSIAQIAGLITKIDFLEVRVNAAKLAKFDDQKIYLRNIISRSKWIQTEYTEFPGFNCDICNQPVLQGTYTLRFWEQSLSVPYWICPRDGATFDSPESPDSISKFMSNFR